VSVGGNRARRWTPTQQPPESPPTSEGEHDRSPPPPEKGGEAWLLTLPLLIQLLISSKYSYFGYFYYERETKHLGKSKAKKTSWSLRISLLISECPFYYKGVTIYRRPPGMIIHLNYTFSVPDNRLFTLYKGITVTPCVVQASSVSSHSQTAFTHCAPCLYFVRRPFTCLLWPCVMATSRRSQGPPLAPRLLLTDKTSIHLRSASVRTYTFFTTGFPRFLSIRGARGLLALNKVLI
jgi:hypothetical protein